MDTSTVKDLAKSLPKPDEQTEILLGMERLGPKGVERETAALAKHGHIGCLPLATYLDTWIVIRLLPGVPLAKCPVGEAKKRRREGETVAPDLARVVAGRLAHLDPDASSLEGVDEDDLFATAELFGDRASTERVLAAVKKRLTREHDRRSGELFDLAGPREPWFQVLAAAWSKADDELSKWLARATDTYREFDLVHRLNVMQHVEDKSAEIGESAWRSVTGDVTFDQTFSTGVPGPGLTNFSHSPFAHAVRWLVEHPSKSDAVRTASLRAGRAYLDDLEGYDGAAHLEAATELASKNPVAAYTLAANAAMFHVRGDHGSPKKAVALALRIAKAERWNDLATVLAWGSKAR